MPIYEYQCELCEHELEVLQKISDPLLSDCPACGKASLRKRISAPSFRLKGGGWYETDFKTGNKRNLAGDAKSGDGKPASGDAKSAPDANGSDGKAATKDKVAKPAGGTGDKAKAAAKGAGGGTD